MSDEKYGWIIEELRALPSTSDMAASAESTDSLTSFTVDRLMHAHITDQSLQEFYGKAAAAAHTTAYSGDSGFDLFVPEDITIPPNSTGTIDHRISCEPLFAGGYYLYPRSSISKTPLRLANSVGIIDNGYRGHLMAKVDNRSNEPFTVRRGERLFQLCHPSLLPLKVKFVDSLSSTERGAGGFGSSGK